MEQATTKARRSRSLCLRAFVVFLRRLGIALTLLSALLTAVAASRAHLSSPAPTLLLLDRHGRFLAEVENEEGFGYWPLKTLPARVVAATIALEDRRFWKHPGVDPVAIARAAWQNLRNGRRISGASTLAMQVARMQTPGDRTYARKAIEALTALFLTHRYERGRILAHYLRIAPYANRIHGISYAARRYFDKPVEDLSWAETALLTALPQAPERMNPYAPQGMAAAIRRGRRILDTLFQDGDLTQDEYSLALSQLARLRIPEPGRRPEDAMHALLHLQKILAIRQPSQILVQTTLDLDLQQEIAWRTFEAVRTWERYGAGNAAVILLDRKSNEVLAWVGSADYFDSRHAGAIDYTQVPRSSGSTLKPFLYAAALERGAITAASILDDLQRGPGGITNADDAYLGPLLPRVALANSRNVPAVGLLTRTGIDEVYGLLRDLGLHAGNKPARYYGLGLAVGALPVTLEDLVRAYSVLANDGVLRDLVWYRGQEASAQRVLSEAGARQITLFLSDPMARLPSFPRMGSTEYPFPVAVKTGTSYAHRDAWTVAYSSRYLIGVWVGHPDYRPMNRLSGYRAPALLAQRILMYLHKDQQDGLEDVSFPPPRGFHPVRICGVTGKLSNPHCDRVFQEWFRPGQEPVEECDAHTMLAVDARNGQPASTQTPAEFVQVRAISALDPRYAAWAAQANLPLPPMALKQNVIQNASLRITLPENGSRLQRDPETPTEMNTLALQAIVDPPALQVVWYVDGAPFQVSDYPYTARWPIQTGEHKFQVQIPYTGIMSNPIRVFVQ